MTITKLIDELVRIRGYEVRIFVADGDWFVDVFEPDGRWVYQHYSVDLTLSLQGALEAINRRKAHPNG